MTAFFIVDKRIPCRNVGRGFLIERSVPLPDNHALLDRHIHLAVGDVEGIEEILEVAQRSVHAPLTERVYVEFGQIVHALESLQHVPEPFLLKPCLMGFKTSRIQ